MKPLTFVSSTIIDTVFKNIRKNTFFISVQPSKNSEKISLCHMLALKEWSGISLPEHLIFCRTLLKKILSGNTKINLKAFS